jgi:pimeloyl-ACP methyl ester carboxylesterase
MLVGRNADDALLSRTLAVIRSVSASTLTVRLRQVLDSDARNGLRAIAVPIFYLQAAHDKLVSPASLDEIRNIKPDILSQKIESSHLLLQTAPTQAATVIANFIYSQKLT